METINSLNNFVCSKGEKKMFLIKHFLIKQIDFVLSKGVDCFEIARNDEIVIYQ